MSQELSKALLLSAPPVKEETVRKLSLFTGFSFSSLLTAVLGYAEQLPWSTILTVVEDIVNTVSPTASWSEVLAFIVAELDKLVNQQPATK